MDKCKYPDGIEVKAGGLYDIDPCIYENVQCIKNATVIVSRCRICGNVVLSWKRQENTEEIEIE